MDSFTPPIRIADDGDSFASGVEFSQIDSIIVEDMPSSRLDDKEKKQLTEITKKESKAVFWLRTLLVIVLLLAAIIVSVAAYYYTYTEERNAFREQFESDALKIFEDIGRNFDLTMGAADSFMIRVISQAKSTDAVWPMVTIPDLAVQAAKLIAQTDSICLAFYPLITGEQRANWENFTKPNDEWVDEALKIQASNPNFHGPILKNYTKSHTIWGTKGLNLMTIPGHFYHLGLAAQ